MLTGIVKATRAHYAALQHRPSADRVALDYEVTAVTADGDVKVCGTVYVKVPSAMVAARSVSMAAWSRRQAELTRLTNRLRSMCPEATRIECAYRDGGRMQRGAR